MKDPGSSRPPEPNWKSLSYLRELDRPVYNPSPPQRTAPPMNHPRSHAPRAFFACLAAVALTAGADLTAQQDKRIEAALSKAVRAAQAKLEQKATLWTDHSKWARARIVKSKYFAVRTTQNHVYGKRMAEGLDAMAGHFKSLLKPDHDWGDRAQILLFPTLTDYNTAGNNANTQAVHSSIYGSFYASEQTGRPVAAVFHANYTLVCIEVTHSAVHHFLDRAYPGATPPIWVQEGLAGYFSLYWSWSWGASELARFQEQKSWVPLDRALKNGLNRYGNKAHQHFIQLGMLFKYLLHERADTKSTPDDDGVQQGPFADYLRKTLQGIDVKKHPVHKLLFENTKQLEAELKAHEFK